MKPQTHQELVLLRQKKFQNSYKVKDSFGSVTKDVDFSLRTVKVIPNTFYYFDSDQDVLLPGSTAKSIAERGPSSNSPAKIKNIYAHDLKTQIGKPTVMSETTIDGNKVQYAESKLLTTTKGNDTLIEYQEGVIDQHSIGFQYVDMDLVTADDKDWTKSLSMLINPKDVEAYGYMFQVKEIKQFEFSPVLFGANELTPFLGVKSGNPDLLAIKVMDRIDLLEKQLHSGRQSDEAMYDYSLEVLQLKQIITELFLVGPSVKDTLLIQRRQNEDTQEKAMRMCEKCLKSFMAPGNDSPAKCPECGQFVNGTTMPVPEFDFGKALQETTFFNFSI